MIGGGVICWSRLSDVVPLATHTRLPDRSPGWRIGESRGARMRWFALRYTVEKFTSSLRAQVMVMVLTTTSTSLFSSAETRSAEDRIRYSTWAGVPKMSRAISPAMSTSKPVISPVIGSRKLNRLLPMSRPTISRPRFRMLATASSASSSVSNGRRLAVRSQSSSAGVGGWAGSGGSSSMPAGVGGASVTPGSGTTGAASEHAVRTVSTAAAARDAHALLIV